MYFISSVVTIWEREVIRYTRDRARILSTLFQPIMFLVIFGAGLRGPLASSNLGIDFLKFMYPGIIAMNVMGIAFFSSISTVWDREFGFLKEILVAPVSRTAIVLGKALGATTIASTQALILLVIAPFIGLSIHPLIVLHLFLFMLLLSFAISGMSLVIASVMKTMESFGVLMQLFIFPMFFLSGAFFPLTSVPSWMVVLSRINPLTYGVDATRQIILGTQVDPGVIAKLVIHPVYIDALFLFAFSLLMITISAIAFNQKD
ncbi:MAG: ABC transporter permease [Candidatus Moraniibacteriota bacterium]